MAARPNPDLRRLHAITANYFFWQGLRWVPPGAALILLVWSTMPSFPLPASWRDATPWLALTVGLAASWLIGKYYTHTYGYVRGLPGMHARRNAIKWSIVYPMIALALMVDGLLKPPIMVSALMFAVSIEAYRRSTGGGRRHYVLASVLFAIATFAPALGFVQPGHDVLVFVLGSLGGVYMIGGVFDHLELRRLLQARGDYERVETV
jgi:hypothetical protein